MTYKEHQQPINRTLSGAQRPVPHLRDWTTSAGPRVMHLMKLRVVSCLCFIEFCCWFDGLICLKSLQSDHGFRHLAILFVEIGDIRA